MDNNTIYKLSLVALARKEQAHKKNVTLELLKAIVSNPSTDYTETKKIKYALEDLVQLYYSITDLEEVSDLIFQADHEREKGYEIQKECGISDDEENISIISTMIDVWDLSILNLLQESVEKKDS
jgi:hypothetical protein